MDGREAFPPDCGECGRDRDRAERTANAIPRTARRGHPPASAASSRGRRIVSFFGSLAERVRKGLQRTRDRMDDGLDALLQVGRPVDDALLDELEEMLIVSDLGAYAA